MSAIAVQFRSATAWKVIGGSLGSLAAIAAATALPPSAIVVVLVLALVVATIGLSRRDPLVVLSLLGVLLLVIPEQYVLVGPLKSYGYPAQIVGVGAFAVWAGGRMIRHPAMTRGSRPFHWLIFMYAALACASLIAAYNRSLSSAELAGSLRSVASTVAAIGVALLAADGLRQRADIDAFLRRLIVCAGIEAFLGILQFLDKGFSIGFLQLPGLKTNNSVDLQLRSDFVRVHSTGIDTIEFAVLVSALVPIGLHYAIHADTKRRRVTAAVCTVFLLAAAPMTVARSGVVALVVALTIYAVQWSGRARLNAAVLGAIGLIAYRAAFPGLLGTLRSLLFIGNNDPSIAHRTADYAKIPALMIGHVLFGRGLGTFLPDQYFFLDNQYLGTYIEGGLISLIGMIVLLLGFMSLARGARKRSVDAATRSLGQALAGSLAAFAVTAGTFDEFGFKQTYFVLFAVAGAAAALWQSTREGIRLEGVRPVMATADASFAPASPRTRTGVAELRRSPSR